MLERFDWKFGVMLMVTVAGVVAGAAVPMWLYRAELFSKALVLTVKSSTEIQPQGVSAQDGLDVQVDGKRLEKPSFAVLELVNSGSRPILAADFEGPLKLTVTEPAIVVKARIVRAEPTSLVPRLAVAGGVVEIQPLLLNPNDTVQLSVVTANEVPKFRMQARIAGVSDVAVNEVPAGNVRGNSWYRKILGCALFVVYVVCFADFIYSGTRRGVYLWFELYAAVVACFGGLTLFGPAGAADAGWGWSYGYGLALACLVGLPISYLRQRIASLKG